MALQRLDGDLHVTGRISSASMTVPDSTVDNDAVASDAAIAATKLVHRHHKEYAQEAAANASAGAYVIHVARAAGSVIDFAAGLIVAADTAPGSSGRTATMDLKKNGTTVLTGTIQLDNANTAYVIETATISSAAYVAGDVFTVVITAGGSVGTYPKGIFAQATFHEGT